MRYGEPFSGKRGRAYFWSRNLRKRETSPLREAEPAGEGGGVSVAERDECRHHWLIDTPEGPVSQGVCKLCGAQKEFRNYPAFELWEDAGEAGVGTALAEGQTSEESYD